MKKSELINLFSSHIIKIDNYYNDETYIEVSRDMLPEIVAELMVISQGTLMSIICIDERELSESKCFKIHYAFKVPFENTKDKNPAKSSIMASDELKEILVLTIKVFEAEPEFHSITNICLAANWYEREIADMFGLKPIHHLDMKRLCHHEKFPQNIYPLRKDFAGETAIIPMENNSIASKVEGHGIYELPVGPIHAGIIEPGHFRFSCLGEHIINLDAKLFFTHRGLEKMAEGMDHFKANFITERVCGVCSLSHSVAYSNAVEKICGTEVPKRAKYLRTILLELERISGHLTDIMGIALDVAYYSASTFASILRENILETAYEILRSRYFHSINMPGGLRRDITGDSLKKIEALAERLPGEIDRLSHLLLSSTSFLERVETTGYLFTNTALELGIVGVGARASKIKCDARKAFGYEAYNECEFNEITGQAGDVYSRMMVRLGELQESAKIIKQLLSKLPQGKISEPIGTIPPFKPAFGITEAPKGEHSHFVVFDNNAKIYRLKIRSASFANWLALTFAVKGNIVPDFPVINKSFNLCYSACDR